MDIKIKDLKIFAFIWSFIFCTIGIYQLIYLKQIVFIVIALCFLFIGIIKPILLNFFYKIWIKIGDIIGGFISKIILFILFFALFSPIAIVLKIFSKDLLNKKLDKSKKSYWIDRKDQPLPMKNQF